MAVQDRVSDDVNSEYSAGNLTVIFPPVGTVLEEESVNV